VLSRPHRGHRPKEIFPLCQFPPSRSQKMSHPQTGLSIFLTDRRFSGWARPFLQMEKRPRQMETPLLPMEKTFFQMEIRLRQMEMAHFQMEKLLRHLERWLRQMEKRRRQMEKWHFQMETPLHQREKGHCLSGDLKFRTGLVRDEKAVEGHRTPKRWRVDR
jgi:hypothetical protein